MKKISQALKFIRAETTSLSNCIFRLNKEDGVNRVMQRDHYNIYYVFPDNSALKTNITGNEIQAVQL